MSTVATAQSQPRPQRGGNPGRGRRTNRGGRGRGAPNSVPAAPQPAATVPTQSIPQSVAQNVDEAAQEEDDVCWICAEPVKYYSVSACNHRTCHVCALRLRALYKKNECTFCKEPQLSVIFTTSPDALYESFTPESVPFKDSKSAISFETQEMMEDTLILLRFNCPDQQCDYIAKGWADLKLHVRASHNKLLCDLCIRTKKVFAHEHTLYTFTELTTHLPSMNDGRRQKTQQPAKDQGEMENGIHPLCEFCRECFFGNDELYAHMREKHEECFLCKRNEIRDQYFHNYASLERHFNNAHYPCMNSTCQANKFVVFNTTLDLQAHQVEEHGADMTSRDRKNVQRVQAEFGYEEVGQNRRGRREAQPPPRQQAQPPPPPAPGPSRPGRRRGEGFGATLTEAAGAPPPRATPPGPSRRPSPSPQRPDVDAATLERHTAFLGRLNNLAQNPAAAVPAVKAAIRGYRAHESSARDVISTIFNVLDQNLEHTASVVNGVVDLLDEEDKKQDLLSSWKGFDIEQRRQFPDLTPSALGTGYAGIASGRVLNAKQTTTTRSSHQTSNQVWDRVARAASTPGPVPGPSTVGPRADKFPALRPTPTSIAAPTPSPGPAFRQPQRSTPWSASATRSAQSSSGNYSNDPPKKVPPPPTLSKSAFPGLPTAGPARAKPQINGNSSLRNILGTPTAPPTNVWGGGSESASPPVEGGSEVEPAAPGGKGKKGKGKQKQTLFTLGAFPGSA